MATKKEAPFRSLLSEPVKIYTTSGEKMEDVMAMRLNEKGEEEFYISGKTNIYEKIQSHSQDANIENILAKVIATGDTSLLQQRKAEFADLTETPTNIFEAQQKIQEAEKTFMELPMEIRRAYNNNFNEYLADVGSEKWLELVGLKEKTPEEIIPEPEKGEAE